MAEMDANVELDGDGEDEDFFDSVVMAEDRYHELFPFAFKLNY